MSGLGYYLAIGNQLEVRTGGGGLTIAPAVTSRRMLLHATNDDQTPYAVPIFVGSLIKIGIEPTKGMTFIDNANDESTIGPVG